MGFIIIDKDTGDLLDLQIYGSEELAEQRIKRGGYYLPNKYNVAIIPMPSKHVLKVIANDDANYTTIRYRGEFPFTPIEWD